MDDPTEVLDECGANALPFRHNADSDPMLKGAPLVDYMSGRDQDFDLSAMERCSVLTWLKKRIL